MSGDVEARLVAALDGYLHDQITPLARRKAIQAVKRALKPGDDLGNGLLVLDNESYMKVRAAGEQQAAADMRERCASTAANLIAGIASSGTCQHIYEQLIALPLDKKDRPEGNVSGTERKWSCGWSEQSGRCMRFHCNKSGPCDGYIGK